LGIAFLANPKPFGIVIEWMQKAGGSGGLSASEQNLKWLGRKGKKGGRAQRFRSEDQLTMKLEVKHLSSRSATQRLWKLKHRRDQTRRG
jgi:hypothetical protein